MKKLLSFFVIALLFQKGLYAQEALPSVVLGKSKIYYEQKGSGTPVVFVSGMAHGHDTWKLVQDSISNRAMTVSYDRAGLGISEYHGEKKDLTSMANELDRLLTQISVPFPVILVGHSLGSQIIKKYAALYAQKIKGLVFVDPGYNENILRSRISDSLWKEREMAIKKYQIEFNAAQEEENKNRNQSCEEADKITRLPQVPMVLLTATMVTEFPASAAEQHVKKERHELWLKTMPGAQHVLVPTTWHYIHTDAPAEVIKAINSLLAK